MSEQTDRELALEERLRACVVSLKLAAREMTKSETGEWQAWTHPANSIRWAEELIGPVA